MQVVCARPSHNVWATLSILLVSNSLAIDIACLMWALKIGPAKDKDGKAKMPVESDFINEGVVV